MLLTIPQAEMSPPTGRMPTPKAMRGKYKVRSMRLEARDMAARREEAEADFTRLLGQPDPERSPAILAMRLDAAGVDKAPGNRRRRSVAERERGVRL